jgi:prepilin-type processing-associated H-X9-DG protein
MSWMTRLLPYLEQEALWQQALHAFTREKFFVKPPHLPILGRPMPAFSCPSDSRTLRSSDSDALVVAFTSYLGVAGRDSARYDGLFYLDSRLGFADVPDGLSNTLAVGERPPSGDQRLGWWYAGWGQSKDGSADLLLGVRERNVAVEYRSCSPGPYHFVRGRVENNCDAFHFWSLHYGGANFLFADGSARFLAYTADPLLPGLATRAGGELVPQPD